jgi:hypothetical protein
MLVADAESITAVVADSGWRLEVLERTWIYRGALAERRGALAERRGALAERRGALAERR